MRRPPRSVRRSSCFALGCLPSGRPGGLTRSLPLEGEQSVAWGGPAPLM